MTTYFSTQNNWDPNPSNILEDIEARNECFAASLSSLNITGSNLAPAGESSSFALCELSEVFGPAQMALVNTIKTRIVNEPSKFNFGIDAVLLAPGSHSNSVTSTPTDSRLGRLLSHLFLKLVGPNHFLQYFTYAFDSDGKIQFSASPSLPSPSKVPSNTPSSTPQLITFLWNINFKSKISGEEYDIDEEEARLQIEHRLDRHSSSASPLLLLISSPHTLKSIWKKRNETYKSNGSTYNEFLQASVETLAVVVLTSSSGKDIVVGIKSISMIGNMARLDYSYGALKWVNGFAAAAMLYLLDIGSKTGRDENPFKLYTKLKNLVAVDSPSNVSRLRTLAHNSVIPETINSVYIGCHRLVSVTTGRTQSPFAKLGGIQRLTSNLEKKNLTTDLNSFSFMVLAGYDASVSVDTFSLAALEKNFPHVIVQLVTKDQPSIRLQHTYDNSYHRYTGYVAVARVVLARDGKKGYIIVVAGAHSPLTSGTSHQIFRSLPPRIRFLSNGTGNHIININSKESLLVRIAMTIGTTGIGLVYPNHAEGSQDYLKYHGTGARLIAPAFTQDAAKFLGFSANWNAVSLPSPSPALYRSAIIRAVLVDGLNVPFFRGDDAARVSFFDRLEAIPGAPGRNQIVDHFGKLTTNGRIIHWASKSIAAATPDLEVSYILPRQVLLRNAISSPAPANPTFYSDFQSGNSGIVDDPQFFGHASMEAIHAELVATLEDVLGGAEDPDPEDSDIEYSD